MTFIIELSITRLVMRLFRAILSYKIMIFRSDFSLSLASHRKCAGTEIWYKTAWSDRHDLSPLYSLPRAVFLIKIFPPSALARVSPFPLLGNPTPSLLLCRPLARTSVQPAM